MCTLSSAQEERVVHLSLTQAKHFYRIWFALLGYVNDQRRLLASFPTVPGEATVLPSDAKQLRDALWADDALRETFVAENSAGLPPDDLAVVASWQHRLAGNFYVFRYLKRHTVFLSSTRPTRAYGVLGLVSPIEEILGPYIPIYVQAVVLPFEDQIIYDGLLEGYSISFGPGIRGDLNDAYRSAQEREGIITTLLPVDAAANPDKVRGGVTTRNAKLLRAFGTELAKSRLSLTTIEQHVGTIEAFAQTYLLEGNPPRGLLDMTLGDVQTYLAGAGKRANATSFKRFVRFLLDTGRMDYERARPLQEFLKKQTGR